MLSPSALLSASVTSCALQAATTHTCGTRPAPPRYASRCDFCGAGWFAVWPFAACVHLACNIDKCWTLSSSHEQLMVLHMLNCFMLCGCLPGSVAVGLANSPVLAAVPCSRLPYTLVRTGPANNAISVLHRGQQPQSRRRLARTTQPPWRMQPAQTQTPTSRRRKPSSPPSASRCELELFTLLCFSSLPLYCSTPCSSSSHLNPEVVEDWSLLYDRTRVRH